MGSFTVKNLTNIPLDPKSAVRGNPNFRNLFLLRAGPVAQSRRFSPHRAGLRLQRPLSALGRGGQGAVRGHAHSQGVLAVPP